ncbi:MAG: hypothetical protein BWY66_00124 [bacterium ADurb.Bin374]|nr:MAG: hypothetical protein BWY66_00124 [bacterium ADurb.Bin374]
MPRTKRVGSLPSYRIFETQEFIDRLQEFPKTSRLFLEKKLTTYTYPQLKSEPHFGLNIKKLVDYMPSTWRYRIGKYRLFSSIDEKQRIVTILTIDFRKDAYR